jgi:hypothetical protein
MYPTEKKKLYTSQGEWLRKMCGLYCIIHTLFFGIALAFTGF